MQSTRILVVRLLWAVLPMLAAQALGEPLIVGGPPENIQFQGSGTAAEPYRISTARQLQEMRKALDAHYVLAGDVDASETAAWNSEKGFEPVGSRERPFTGCFDGQGHSII